MRLVLIALILGCTPLHQYHQAAAIREWDIAWEHLDGQQAGETVILDRVVVHIGGPSPCGPGAVGCATTAGEVWVRGKVVDGQIIVDQWVLGHEVTHLLNWLDRRIKNPDE